MIIHHRHMWPTLTLIIHSVCKGIYPHVYVQMFTYVCVITNPPVPLNVLSVVLIYRWSRVSLPASRCPWGMSPSRCRCSSSTSSRSWCPSASLSRGLCLCTTALSPPHSRQAQGEKSQIPYFFLKSLLTFIPPNSIGPLSNP